MLCNLISTQLHYIATEKFDTNPKLHEGNAQLGRALGLLLIPHLVLMLLESYTVMQAQLLFASMLLNIIPATLIIVIPIGTKFKFKEMSRYSTLPALSYQMKEMMSFNYTSESDAQSDDVTEPEAPEQLSQEAVVDIQPHLQTLTPLNVQTYYSNAGVSILPEIPEEEEDDINTISAKRLSVISTRLEAINQKDRRDSIREVFNINDLMNKMPTTTEEVKTIEYIQNYKNENKFIEIKLIKSRNWCCQPYKLFVWKRRLRRFNDFLIDNFRKPLMYSLKDPYFYPTVISKGSLTFVSAAFIAIAPYLALTKNNFRMEDTPWVLSYIAFTWCLFLLVLPLISSFSNGRLRILFVMGLFMTACSMLILTKLRPKNDLTILSCLMFGLGFGIISYTEAVIHRWFIGARKWTMIKGAVDTLSAFLVILIYFIIVLYKVDVLNNIAYIALVVYLCNCIFWSVAPVLVLFVGYLKRPH
ncbi:unnamed protein product [Acanthoscelides obtectus]|nr:unnamed protein product [Acanthoscelides obtectus]CAK1671111.1 hypothetical protein AOBTE_LOCUS28064 [Acanthoscelides obtectus]